MKPPNMLAWALRYAQLNYQVIPLHTPIVDEAGNCTGCSCEEYKRSDKYRRSLAERGRVSEYDPAYTCPTPGKHPRLSKWEDKATTDPEQIRTWWRWWPQANIGIAAGKSDLLVLDLDEYKERFAGVDLLTAADENTVTVGTGSGGRHLWYTMPDGARYGNETGELPDGIDIRGHGGLVVAPPSLHPSGRRYTFAEGWSPGDIDPQPLPVGLRRILDEAQAAKQEAHSVNFTPASIVAPDLARLPQHVVDLIQAGAAKGDRSEAVWRVCCEMARTGYSDDEIRAVMVHYPIGAKYDERGDKWLALTIGKARAANPTAPPASLEELEAALWWVRTDACIFKLRAGGIRRAADYIKTLAGLVKIAMRRRSRRIVVNVRDVGEECGAAASTAHRHLGKIADTGLIDLATEAKSTTTIDLSPLLDLSGTDQEGCGSVPLRSTSVEGYDFFAEHIADDAFTSYPYTYAIRRREAPSVLAQSLGATALLLWEPLLEGGTVKELALESGLTESSIRGSLKRYRTAGLLFVWKEGRANVYQLHPNAEQRLEERREHMVTAGCAQLRMGRNESSRAEGYRYHMRRRRDLSQRDKARMGHRIEQANAKALACFDGLEDMGINPYVKVAHRRSKPKLLKVDPAAEWEKVADLWQMWREELGDMPETQRRRTLEWAGFEPEEIDSMLQMAKRAGKRQRDFILAPEVLSGKERAAWHSRN